MDERAIHNFVQNIFNLWVSPELEGRKKQSFVGANYTPRKIQIIFLIDGRKLFRFDDEIRASIITNKAVGENQDFDKEGISIERLDRVEEEEDFGHVTMVKVRDLWVIAFDFRYGVGESREIYNIGKDFLDAARYFYEHKNYRAMYVNLYFSAENFGKARVYLYPDAEIRKTVKHRSLAGKINIYSKDIRIIDSDFKEAFNILQNKYNDARYNNKFSATETEATKILNFIEKFSKEILKLYDQKLIFKN